jgi:beta-phosphoglucomutase-like phosphatase (HAD superfamily)
MDYFDCIRTKEDVAMKKPDPEIYHSVLYCLQVAPQNAIAFEDPPVGAIAAKLAGMRCVVVPNYVTEKLAFADDVDYKLTSMLDMKLEELTKRFN